MYSKKFGMRRGEGRKKWSDKLPVETDYTEANQSLNNFLFGFLHLPQARKKEGEGT